MLGGAIRLSQPKRGFTLAELLAVLAIMAALFALIVPALAGAREQSRRGVCAVQLRGMVDALADQERYPFTYPEAFASPCPSDRGEIPTGYGRSHRGPRSYRYHPQPWEFTGEWRTLVLDDAQPWHDGGVNEARGDGAVTWRSSNR